MKQLAPDLWLLRSFPPNAINCYVAGDVLIDARTKLAAKSILSELDGVPLSAHALTHAHADHQGASHAVCEARGIPLWCGAGDADAMAAGETSRLGPDNALTRIQGRFWTGPAHPVARRLAEGDEVGGFVVRETPGHSPGHVVFWREADRVLILGDVLNNMNTFTGIRGLREPPELYTLDPARNRASARSLLDLEPALVLFGHGPPLLAPARFRRFLEALPA